MNVRHIKKGQMVDMTCRAGADMAQYEWGGIVADVFDSGDHYDIPVIQSFAPGSGKLDEFLKVLREELKKPIMFRTVVNPGLARHLVKNGINFD